MSDSRADFEAWHEDEFDPSNPHANVVFSLKETRWKAWTAARASQWRPIFEYDPGPADEPSEPVLTLRGDRLYSVAFLEGTGWRCTDGVRLLDVHHWQPLPQPPVSK